MNYDDLFSASARAIKASAIRQMGAVAAERTDIISFAPGYPSEQVFAFTEFHEIAAEVLSGAEPRVLQYGPTTGLLELRDALVELQSSRGIRSTVDDVMVTTGSQQGLELVAQVLLDPGDVVLVELPSYTGAITAFGSTRADLVGIRQDAEGLDLEDLERVWSRLRREGRRVKFVYVVPNFQNPTGLLMSPSRRRGLLEWASRRNVLIVEDDPYGELYFADSSDPAERRPVCADDGEGRTIYLSTFSKTLAPGYRVGWLHAPRPVLSKLETLKQAVDLCTGGLDQRVVLEAIKRGVLGRNLPALRAHYRHSWQVMSETLRERLGGLVSWPEPRGGFFLWVTLPDNLDARTLLQAAMAQGVIFVVGSAFFVDGTGENVMRLSFSHPPPERIREGIQRLASTVGTLLDARSTVRAPAERG